MTTHTTPQRWIWRLADGTIKIGHGHTWAEAFESIKCTDRNGIEVLAAPGRHLVRPIPGDGSNLESTNTQQEQPTMTTTTKTTTLWTDLNGRVCCPDHMGCYATQTLEARPNTRVIETDITVWERMTKTEITDWAEFITETYGQTELCETCRSEAKR